MDHEKGRKEKFQTLFRAYFGSMCVFATRYLEDEEEAKDVVHDVFCGLWEDPSMLDRVENERGYLYTIVKNRCIDVLRRREIHARYERNLSPEEKEDPVFFDEEVAREELYRLLDEGIERLPERCKEIILLKLKGLKNQEIADKLGVALSTVNTLKNIAYKELRAFLGKRYFALFVLLIKGKSI